MRPPLAPISLVPASLAAISLIPVALALLAVGGCNDSSPATPPAKPITVRSEGQDRLHQLNDLNRAIALKRAIRASGNSCKRVTASGYVAEHGNLSMWTAACDERLQWAVFVGPDDSVQVRPCGDMARFKLPSCIVVKSAQKPPPSGG